MRRTKVFYFIPNLQQGGPERQILELMGRLPARFEPVLCVYDRDNVFFDAKCPPGQPKHALGVKNMGWKALRRLQEILVAERPDILHSWRDKANFWARLAAPRAGVPITVTACRNRMMEPRHLVLERWLSRRSDLILTNSRGVEHELVHWARVDPGKIRVIYNILDVELFRPPSPEERSAARQRWEVGPEQRVLLLPGRLGLQKHQLGLLRALRALGRRGGLPPQTVLLLAGRDRDLKVTRLVRWLAADPALRDRVRFLGAQKDMRSLYWAADLLVMPSLFEGLANAALEGCAAGLPALLSHAANVDGIVEPGVTGLEVPTLRHRPLVDALGELLAVPAARLQEMGARSRDRMVARFAPSSDHVVNQFVAVYDELLALRAPTATPAASTSPAADPAVVAGGGRP